MKKQITEFFNNEYASASAYVTTRVIPSMIDSFCLGARKIIAVLETLPANKLIKISSLSSKAVESMAYVHGSTSLDSTISIMGQDFLGSNNTPLLKSEGNLGSRHLPEPSASRYVQVMFSEYFSKFYKKEDYPLIEKRTFEGQQVEPKFYLPIIPTILMFRSQGIGSGFSSSIYGRKLSDIISALRSYLSPSSSNPSPTKIPVFIRNFKGNTSFYSENKFEVSGSYSISKNTITITEIPFDYSLAQYLKILDDLEEAGIIKSYADKSDNDEFLFEVKVTNEFLTKSDAEIRKILKLNKKLYETFNCLGPNDEILTFENEGEIIKAFVEFRLPYFQKRLDYQIATAESDLLKATNQWNFVQGILDESLVVYKKKKAEIEIFLTEKKFDQIEDSFEYLLSMRIDSMTDEKLKDLGLKISKLKSKIKELKSKDGKSLWLEELAELEKID